MANPANFTINELAGNTAMSQPTGDTIDSNGTVNLPAKSLTDRLMVEIINNDDAALTVTFKAGTGVQAHTARDLVVSLAASGGGATAKRMIGPFESSRFVKSDGSIDVAFLAATGSPAATVRVYRLPRRF